MSRELAMIAIAIAAGSRDPVRLARQVCDEIPDQPLNDVLAERILTRVRELINEEAKIATPWVDPRTAPTSLKLKRPRT